MPLTFKQEFQLKNFKFNYSPVNHFFESPWLPTPVVILYRSVFALYSLSWIVYRLIADEKFRQKVTFFYVTNWSYLALIIYFLVSSVVTIFEYIKRRRRQVHTTDTERGHVHASDGQARWFHMIQWFWYSIAATMAIGVTLFFWLFDYDGMGITLSDVNVHLLNAVFMIIDHALSCMPVRLFHMVYPMIFVSLYMIATVLYWAFISKDYIYKMMDYNTNPGVAVGLLLAAMLIAAPLIHSLYYGTYRLREYVAAKTRKAESKEPEREMEEKEMEENEVA
ncbi:protein rolling stone [Exaiptasia diaphana]|uniref:Protein rolling stone n=1 Tax=Exaiptasia diaphana TaxID=2652724 RepID=A0A913XPG6_EXADI|nr:protein rolling stone [Exaiptasia diaphana]KXJ25471.1 Protein rolling stone [Exaiptasia diaphana]